MKKPAFPTAALLLITVTGCGDVLLGLADMLDGLAGGLRTVGGCLTPVEYTDLSEVLVVAPPAEWRAGQAILTDAAQPAVEAFFASRLEADVAPRWYQNERLFRLACPPPDRAAELEFLDASVDWAHVYDDEGFEIASLRSCDFDGRLRGVVLPPSGAAHLVIRLVLIRPGGSGRELARLAEVPAEEAGLPRTQHVVLNMGGAAGIRFRAGTLVPTNVSPVTDPVLREALVRAVAEIYAPYDLRVYTEADPSPPEPYSVVHIGTAEPPLGYNGLSEWVDGLNRQPDAIAIVDLGSRHLGLAGLFGPEALGTAAGLVAAHEVGHLLGLWHSLNTDDLMTGVDCEGAGLDLELLLARRFRPAALESTFAADRYHALGRQDPESVLLRVLGPTAQP